MPSVQSTIFISVFSGILTSLIIYLGIKIFSNIIIPWYRNLKYQGIEVSGTWYGRMHGGSQIVTLELSQTANFLTGIAAYSSATPQHGHYEPLRIFELKGNIQDRFVSLFASHKDKQRLGFSSFLLEVVGDGRKLNGMTTFYSVTSIAIVSDPMIFTRELQPPLDGTYQDLQEKFTTTKGIK